MTEEPGRGSLPAGSSPGTDRAPGLPPGPGPEETARIIRSARRSMWFGGASFLLTFTRLFYIAVVLGVLALVIGVRAVRAARRAHISAPGAVPGIVMGGIATVCSLMLLALSLFLYRELSDYAKCRDSATTISDQNQCKEAFARAFEKKLHMPRGSLNDQQLFF